MNSTVDQSLEYTGERYLPEVGGDIELEHTHRYLLASEFVADKQVLDIASGEGYGSAFLSQYARQVTGVDIDPAAVEHATRKYVAKNLEYLQGDCKAIPLGDASVDIVVSFETIEHHTAHDEMMAEIKRVLRPGGLLIMSSPDKAEYSDTHGTENEFHVRELYRPEFEDLLARYFANHIIQGQRVVYGSLLAGEEPGQSEFLSYQQGANRNLRTSGLPGAIYLIAFASDGPLAVPPNSTYTTESPAYQQEMEYMRTRLDSRAVMIRDVGARLSGAATALVENRSDMENGLSEPLHDLADDPASEQILSNGLAQLGRQISTLREQNNDLRARLSALESAHEAAKALAEQRDQRQTADIERLTQALNATHGSVSWRVTSPLRVTTNAVRAVTRRGRGLVKSNVGDIQSVSGTGGADEISEPLEPVLSAPASAAISDQARWFDRSSSSNDSRPRVLILPAVFAVGGVERLTAAIMRQLNSQFRFVIVSNEPHSEQSGCLFDEVTQFSEAQFDLAAMSSRGNHLDLLAKICQAFPPDLIWVCNGSVWFHQNMEAIMGLFAGKPVVDQQVYDTDAGWINSLTPAYIERVTRVIAINAKIRDRFLEMKIPAEKIDLIYSAVDLAGLRLDARDTKIASMVATKPARRTYAFVARFSEQKRPMDFIEAAIIIAQREPSIDFLMVGDGPLAPSCNSRIEQSGVNNITVRPFTNDLPNDVYATVDALVFVSGYEGLPLAMLEALASGVPVLATDVGDIRLVADELGGGCVVMEDAIGSPTRIADAIVSFDEDIVKHQNDARRLTPVVRQRFGSETVSNTYFDCWASAWQAFADRDLAL